MPTPGAVLGPNAKIFENLSKSAPAGWRLGITVGMHYAHGRESNNRLVLDLDPFGDSFPLEIDARGGWYRNRDRDMPRRLIAEPDEILLLLGPEPDGKATPISTAIQDALLTAIDVADKSGGAWGHVMGSATSATLETLAKPNIRTALSGLRIGVTAVLNANRAAWLAAEAGDLLGEIDLVLTTPDAAALDRNAAALWLAGRSRSTHPLIVPQPLGTARRPPVIPIGVGDGMERSLPEGLLRAVRSDLWWQYERLADVLLPRDRAVGRDR